MMHRRVMVTGANGFVGKAFCTDGSSRGMSVRGVTRRPVNLSAGVENSVVESFKSDTPWQAALTGCEFVVHLAARVHVMNDSAADPLAEFRRVNVQGTLNLARQAAAAGVRRFVFISSVKVNGESTLPGVPFTPEDVPAPQDAYGISKMEAEQGLLELASRSGMEVVIIRPPLVYGPGVKANFALLIRWLQRGVPLPLGDIHNLRSLVALDNLVDFICTCITHPAAANQIFLVSDGEDVSTPDLLRRLGSAMGRPARLVAVPPSLLTLGLTLVGKRSVAQRLSESLQVDTSKARTMLGWSAPQTLDQGLRSAVLERPR